MSASASVCVCGKHCNPVSDELLYTADNATHRNWNTFSVRFARPFSRQGRNRERSEYIYRPNVVRQMWDKDARNGCRNPAGVYSFWRQLHVDRAVNAISATGWDPLRNHMPHNRRKSFPVVRHLRTSEKTPSSTNQSRREHAHRNILRVRPPKRTLQ